MLTPDEIAEVVAGIDRDQAEREAREADPLYQPPPSWAQRAPQRRRQGPGHGLVYRTTETPLAATAYSEATRFVSEADLNDAADTIGEATVDLVANAISKERAERDREIGELRRDLAELRGKLDALLTIVGKSGADVVAPPTRKVSG
jgi:hypothetical protein